jgi:2-amino-4-hydroxy-6-hydroxymethyldihydropteridine diphosphokinase
MVRCFVGLGANQGDPATAFSRVCDALDLAQDLQVVAVSSTYETKAMGRNAGADFHNAVVELDAARPPLEILAELLALETGLGRIRGVTWGPRVIDLDLLYFGETRLVSESLTVPHPHAWYRRFVLEPMCEIAAEFLHPEWSLSQRELRERIDRRPFRLRLPLSSPLLSEEAIDRLRKEYPDVEIELSDSLDESPSLIVAVGGGTVSSIPRIDPRRVPAECIEEALRSVLDACLGTCRLLE